MDTIKRRILSLTLALVAAAMLCACNDHKGANVQVKLRENSDTCVVIEATADDSSHSLADALKSLKAAGQLDYESDSNGYITSVNGHAANATAHEYWAIYTTLTERDGATYSYAEYGNEYDGKMLYSASVGASGLPLYKGELYMFVLETYSTY